MTLLNIDHGLKGTPPEHKMTHAGMAYFAGSGPTMARCGSCLHWSNFEAGREPTPAQKSAACREYTRLMAGKKGPQVPATASACKYYEPRKKK